jgi:hypothetical protein
MFILWFASLRDTQYKPAIGTATGYGLHSRGVGVQVPVSQLFSLFRRYRFWGPTRLLSSMYLGLFTWE